MSSRLQVESIGLRLGIFWVTKAPDMNPNDPLEHVIALDFLRDDDEALYDAFYALSVNEQVQVLQRVKQSLRFVDRVVNGVGNA